MGSLTEIYLALLDFVAPLRRRLGSSDALEYLFYRYGWNAALDDAGFARLQQVVGVVAPLEAFIAIAERLRDARAANPDASISTDDAVALAEAAGALVRALADFKPSDVSGLADPFGRADFWESIAEAIFDDLLEEYLRVHQPKIFLVLRLWRVVRYDQTTPTEPGRASYTRTWFDWAQALAMVQTPLPALEKAYHWGDVSAPFDHEGALLALQDVLHALGVSARRFAPALRAAPPFAAEPDRSIRDDVTALRAIVLEGYVPDDKVVYRLGFEVFPSIRTGDAQPTGLMVRPLIQGGASKTIPLKTWLALTLGASADLTNAVGFALFPNAAGIVGGAPALGVGVTLATTTPAGSATAPWYLVGNAHTAHLEANGFSFKASIGGSVDDPEIALQLSAAGSDGQPGCKLVLPLDDADQFVKQTVKRPAIEISFAPTLVWSSKSGLGFSGSPKLDINLPISVSLGPVTLTQATLTAGPAPASTADEAALALTAGVGLVGSLGPLKVVVDRLGFTCTLAQRKRADVLALPPGTQPPSLGGLDVGIQFAPPTGLGISIDASVVSGGGFLEHIDHTYGGALDLSVCGVAVKAYGLVETQLPGGAPGYSALIVLSAEFSPPLQLGWGFTLDGVGGIVGIDRTLSMADVESAIWSHHFDGLLFPQNPVTAAPTLLSAIDSYFPAASGRYLFGPLAKIGWGGGIVEVLVGLVIELPEPVKLLLFGEIDVQVPQKLPQLVLHVDFAGGVDFGQKLAFFDASLHDSKIERYPIGGDLAFRYDWGDAPVFALAIGGFNPSYQPPANFPTLKRLSLTVGQSGLQLQAQGYLALTSNTLQLGAKVEITAGTGSINIHGFFSFDALVQRDPFAFSLELSAGVDLRSGSTTLASVHLDGKVSGTSPWHVSCDASLSLLFFDVSVHYDKQWGDTAAALPAVDPTPDVLAALRDPSAWSATTPRALSASVTAAPSPTDAAGAVLLDPAGGLRVSQRVVPLGQPITRYLGTPLAAPLTLAIDSPNVLGETATQPADEEFALAQFEDMSDHEKLSLPSFTRLTSGITIADGAIDLGQSGRTRAVFTSIDYETTIIDTVAPPPPPPSYTFTPAAQAALHARLAGFAVPPPKLTLAVEAYVIAGIGDLKARADILSDGSKLGALAALDRYLAANPTSRGQLQVVLAREAA